MIVIVFIAYNNLAIDLILKEEHKCAAIIGSNGWGKNTLLNLIASSIPMDSGEIILNRKDISNLKGKKFGFRKFIRKDKFMAAMKHPDLLLLDEGEVVFYKPRKVATEGELMVIYKAKLYEQIA